jgi:hypothetical protein
MDRIEILWDTPAATLTRCMAAHLERNGQDVNWGSDKLDRLVEELEKRKAENGG